MAPPDPPAESPSGQPAPVRSGLAERVSSGLEDPALFETLDEMARQAFAGDPESEARLRGEAERELSMLVGLVDDLGRPESEQDLLIGVISWWMAVNGRWQVINSRLQTQMQHTGTADTFLFSQAAMLTALLAVVAGEIGPDRERLSAVLADFTAAGETVAAFKRGLLVNARPGELSLAPHAVIAEFEDTLALLMEAQQEVQGGLLGVKERATSSDESGGLERGVAMLDQSIVAFQTTLHRITVLPGQGGLDALAAMARDLVDGADFKAKVKAGRTSGTFPGEHWEALMATGQVLLEHLAASAFDSRQARMEADKPAFVGIKLVFTPGSEEDRLEIVDDGVAPLERPPLPLTPLASEITPTANGARYVVRLPHRVIQRLETYLIFVCGKHRLALPIDDVAMVVDRPLLQGRYVVWQDQVVPLVDLEAVLEPGARSSGPPVIGLVVRLPASSTEPEQLVMARIDRTEAVLNAFPRPVPGLMDAPLIRGFVADGAGELTPVLDTEVSLRPALATVAGA